MKLKNVTVIKFLFGFLLLLFVFACGDDETSTPKEGEGPAEATDSAIEQQAETETEEPVLEKITINTDPDDAGIFLNGAEVGTGRFRDEYNPGESLAFSIRRDGYEEEKLDIDVSEGAGRTYTVTLNKMQEEIGVQTYPGDAVIYLDESKVGEGNYKEKFEVGKKLTFKVEKEGYVPHTLEVDVKEGGGTVYDVSLTKKQTEKEKVKEEEIVVRTVPDNAVIYLNGKRVGTGTFSESFEYGENVDFSFQAEGYESAKLSMTVKQGTGRIYAIDLEPSAKSITVRTTPRTADIFLNGTRVGSGTFSDSFEYGEKLDFSVRESGYEPQTLSMTVTEGSGRTYTVDLPKITERVVIRTTPRNATILYNGREVGTGYFADEFPIGSDLSFRIRETGYREETLSITVREDGDYSYSVNLEPLQERIAVSVTPREAEIFLNGSRVGTGYYSDQFNHGRELSFRIEEEGYETETVRISVREGSGKTYSVALEPRTERISLRTTPDDAAIYLDGERVGSGYFNDEFRYGKKLTFIIRKDGYLDKQLSFTVNEETAKTYSVALEEEIITETVAINTTPSDAKIIVNGSAEGTGAFSREYKTGERLSLKIECDGFVTETRSVTVTENMAPITIKLPVDPSEVSRLSAEPNDATVILSWTEPIDDSYDHIEVWYGTDGTADKKFTGRVDADGTQITGLSNWTEYTFTVKTKYPDGEISDGRSVTVTPYIYNIGDTGPAGGIVFYNDESDGVDNIPGVHYLEAAPSSTEWTKTLWGSSDMKTGADLTALGAGEQNTAEAVSEYRGNDQDEYAALLCHELDFGGYSDWYLPSKDELGLVYQNLKARGFGDFTDDPYWSSTEDDAVYAWIQYFNDGYQALGAKYYKYRVRAIRGF